MTGRRYITPTGEARKGKRLPVQQLGSTEAVLAALPDGAVFIVSRQADEHQVRAYLTGNGRAHDAIKILTATMASYDDIMLRLPRQTPIGIDVAAFDREMSQTWAAAYKHLERFEKVVWG